MSNIDKEQYQEIVITSILYCCIFIVIIKFIIVLFT